MSKRITLLLAIVSLTIYSSVGLASDLPYKPGELLVRFAPKDTGMQRSMQEKNQILTSLGGGIIKHNFMLVSGASVVKLPTGQTVEDALKTFNRTDGILYAEPNYKIKLFSTFPNDPRFDELWGMHNTGQYPPGGTPDADIDAPEGWDIHTGSSEIIVAVIDAGIDYNHPDLAGNMWVNPGEIPGNDIDDDNNGYVDDVYGWDFADDDNNPLDYLYHGTHCAGTVGAIGDNNEGVTGVCWKLKIMNLKVFPNYGEDTFISGAIKAIEYGVDKGAKVLSNSWGGENYSQLLKDEIEQAGAAGVIFVAAAGNPANDDDPNNDTTPRYPASYDCNNIIAVMATDHDDERSIWPVYMSSSAYGPISVDLGAPGTDILSTFPTYETEAMAYYEFSTDYETINGTSMAAPHVTGACALVWSLNPYLSHLEVKDILLQTVDKTLPGLCVSEGRLNLHNALVKAGKWAGLLAKTDNLDPNDSVSPADSITYTISFENNLKDPNDPNLPLGNLTNVAIVDYLPEEVDFTSADSNGLYDPNSCTVTWNIGTVEPNDSNSVTLTVTVNGLAVPSGTILNFCVIDANEILPTTAIEITDVNAWVPDVIYVDKDANELGTGLSWEKAFIDLQDGLEAAETYGSNQIWVAEGTYKPTEPEGPGEQTFQLINGTALYGGFPPGGGQWTDRNPTTYETILNGDLNNDGYANDVKYVVKASDVNETTIIDGFTITKGGINGVQCENASPAIRNNKITQCGYIDPNPYDAGIYCDSSGPNIINCVIEDSTGDGIYCKNNSSAVVRNTEIKNNSSNGIYCYYSEPNITNCIIEGNHYNGICCSYTTAAVVKNNWITGNGNTEGVYYGIYFHSSNTDGIVRNNTIVDNVSRGIGLSCTDVNISNCIFWGNGTDPSHNMWGYFGDVTYSCIEGGYAGGEHIISTDPCFIDDANDNYHLSYDSLCEDAGDPNFHDSNETDIDGQPRNMGDCINRVDIGADEVYFPSCWNCLTQCHGDADCDGDVDTDDWPPFRDGFPSSYPSQTYIDNACGDYDRDGDIDTDDWPEFRDNFSKSVPADCNCGGCWPPGSCEGGGRGQSSGDTTDGSLLEDMIKWIIQHDLPGCEEFLRRLYEQL